MFDELISILKNIYNRKRRNFIKSIPSEILDEYLTVNIYKVLITSKDFEDNCRKIRDSAVRYNQNSMIDDIDTIYAFGMALKGVIK